MSFRSIVPVVLVCWLALHTGLFSEDAIAADPEKQSVDFSRDVLPILGDKCFQCHGPDSSSRKAGLRLDIEKDALRDLGGYRAIEPGRPDTSEILKRLIAHDEDDLMPPPDSGKLVTSQQIEVLRRWIQAGAKWAPHWAFVAPKAAPLAPPTGWERNPIDHFIAAQFQHAGLEPSPQASKEVLIRRLSLDLTGLPPTPEEIDAFVEDTGSNAYEQVVDRLLASPRYGEHQARYWLDAARYADTHGLHHDNRRAIWPYRDFVVRAFNENLSFDKFTRWQLAGDLLPRPTKDQILATGFLRCNVTTNEQGSIEDEVKAHNVRDRTETFSTVFLGLTMGCAACHDHKYDPITQRDFYSLAAFFDNGQDQPMDLNIEAPPPFLRLTNATQEKELSRFDHEVTKVRSEIELEVQKVDYVDPLTEADVQGMQAKRHVWLAKGLLANTRVVKTNVRVKEDKPGELVTATLGKGRLDLLAEELPLQIGQGDELFLDVFLDPKSPPSALTIEFLDDAWAHRVYWGAKPVLVPSDTGLPKQPVIDPPDIRQVRSGALPPTGKWVHMTLDPAELRISVGAKVKALALLQNGGRVRWRDIGIRTVTPQEGEGYDSMLLWQTLEFKKARANIGISHPLEVRTALKKEPTTRTSADKELIAHRFFERFWNGGRNVFDPLTQKKDELERQQKLYIGSLVHSLTYAEQPQRTQPSHILLRGDYDKLGDVVMPQTPTMLPPLKATGQTASRLDLANWLLDPKHPLTSRVTVNRLWQQHFGTGLVKTAWDFGLQGDPPSHPELLDWLATHFVRSGWNVKELHKLIVTSATYRQTSAMNQDTSAKDEDNRWMARGPRFRLDAEVLRDNALLTSGLLVEKLGGAGVKPYQPPGLWQEISLISPISNTRFYEPDVGEGLYRRSLYTFWKRLAPPPSMILFDAPSREMCTVRRERTSTPLQALVLMNDPQFVEAARNLATRIVNEGGQSDDERIDYGFRLVTSRKPDADERTIVKKLLGRRRLDFKRHRNKSDALLGKGAGAKPSKVESFELASWTMVASTFLNLDEAVTLE